MHLHRAFSRPAAGDVPGEDYDSEGRISLALLKRLLPLDDYDYYLCGPGGFMSDLHTGLLSLNIQPGRIHTEAFGPSAIAPSAPSVAEQTGANPAPIAVDFARSGKVAVWNPGRGSLLDLAEAEGIDAPYACRAGACGTCMTEIRAGGVRYPRPPAFDPGDTALICCSVPDPGAAEHLVLEL